MPIPIETLVEMLKRGELDLTDLLDREVMELQDLAIEEGFRIRLVYQKLGED